MKTVKFAGLGKLTSRNFIDAVLLGAGTAGVEAVKPLIVPFFMGAKIPTKQELVNLVFAFFGGCIAYIGRKLLQNVPKVVEVDSTKTSVIDQTTKQPLLPVANIPEMK